MATVGDTLREIELLQKAIEVEYEKNENSFLQNLMNFTTIAYFDYLSHSVLDQAKNINLSQIKDSKKYYYLYNTKGLLDEYIRFNNIGQFYIVWTIYEKYIREKSFQGFVLKDTNVNKLFTSLLNKLNINSNTIKEEFDVIRHTRNSLHDGGVYSKDFKSFRGKLLGVEYSFSPGKEVKPLRVIDVAKVIWNHYLILEKIIN